VKSTFPEFTGFMHQQDHPWLKKPAVSRFSVSELNIIYICTVTGDNKM
jgi:hypothetical protein